MDIRLDGRRDELTAARESLEARHARALVALLTDRDELRGVYALADHMGEGVLWCA